MLKVIIADDEKIQREGILKHISWTNYDMEVIGCSGDGLEALELVKARMPDILITDVKMPKMDGLELSKRARELNPSMKILIISGYEEFEFAKTAIELNANAYILKPIQMGKLRSELERIMVSHRSELLEKDKISEMRRNLEESKPLLKDRFLRDMAYGLLKEEDILRKRAEFLQLALPQSSYYVLLAEFDPSDDCLEDEENKLMLRLNAGKYLEECARRAGDCIVAQHRDNEFMAVLHNFKLEQEEILLFVESIRNSVEGWLKETVTMGISRRKYHLSLFHEGFQEAEAALTQKFYLGKGKCIQYGDSNTDTVQSFSLDESYGELISSIGIGNVDGVEEAVDKIFQLLSMPSAMQDNYLKAFCFRSMSDVYRILYDMNERVETIFGDENVLWSKIYRFDTIPDVRQWLKNIVMTVTRYIFGKKSKKNAGVVDTVRTVLEERYYEQITVEELARKVFLTPNYVSILFRESMGESIIDYLTKVRMRHAQRLLAETELKIYEIAEKTGYNSVSYFSVVFKNTVGLSPREYRDSAAEGERRL